jgi:POT family proton-dependent oligopeptide transporter
MALSFKQPQVFPLAITTSLLERFGFYILIDLLVLYVEHQFNYTDFKANTLFSLFFALVYLTPPFGGYLADNVLGIRRATIIGLFLEALGMILLLIPNELFLYIALALVIIGVGFFKTAPTNLMARSYAENDPRIDGGFTLFYMSINIGSMVSAFVAGFAQRYLGWHIVFFFSALGLAISLLGYFLLRHRAISCEIEIGKRSLPTKTRLKIITLIIGIITICVFLLFRPIIAHIFFYIVTACVLFYFLYEIAKSPEDEKFKIIACLCLIVFGMMFIIMYFQIHSSLTLFIDRCVDHHIFGFYIPTVAFVSLNPVWIIIFSPLLVLLYRYLHHHKKDLAVTTKFALGLLIASLAFLMLKVSTFFANPNYQISVPWLVLSMAMFSLGELLIYALGVAMVTRIAPARMYGVMMGTWFLITSSIGATLGGKVAILADIPKTLTDPAAILNTYGSVYLELGIAGAIITVIAFIANPYIKRLANI